MIEITAVQFVNNPTHYQTLAEQEPVVVDNGNQKQVLMNYDEFLTLKTHSKPFVSLYQTFANVPDELREALSQIDDDEPDDFRL